MHAILINEYGSPDVVTSVDIDKPAVRSDEVLVKIHAAGVNPVDWKIRAGAGQRFNLTLPIILGGEIAGIVEEPGDDVKNLKAGDEVYGFTVTGGYADYISLKPSSLARKPENLDFINAAAIPLAGLTAWQALFDLGKLVKGERVLITGGSGGVGSLAIQLAKAKGAYVISTASGKNEEFVKDLGADEFIDYTREYFYDIAREIDLVIDTVGGETFEQSLHALKNGGRLITIVAFPKEGFGQDKNIRAERVYTRSNSAQLNEITLLIEAGELKPYVSSVFPLSEIKKALALSEEGRTRGKIVIKVA